MAIKINKNHIEIAVVLIFIIAFLYLGIGKILDHQIHHDFPYGYYANDALQNENIARTIYQNGHYRNYPRFGNYDNLVGYYSPVLFVPSVLMSFTNNIYAHDNIIILAALAILLTILCSFIIIRKKFNFSIALLSLPLTFILLSGKFYIVFTWGQWGAIFGTLFLFGFVWSLINKNNLILPVIMLSAAILVHPSEAAWGLFFLTILFMYNIAVLKKNIKDEFIYNLKLGIFSFIVSIYYLIIFNATFIKFSSGDAFFDLGKNSLAGWWGPNTIFLLKWTLILITIGIIYSLFLIKKKEKAPACLFYISMIALAFMGFLGGTFASKLPQITFFWPVYFSLFFGLGVYLIIIIALQTLKQIKRFKSLIVITCSILLSVIIISQFYTPVSGSSGLMDHSTWTTLRWVSKNTPKNSSVLFFYGDIYNQGATLHSTERRSFSLVIDQDFINSIQKDILPKDFKALFMIEGTSHLAYRKGIFEFGYYFEEEKESGKLKEKWNLCDFNYLLFNINPNKSRNPNLIALNLAIRENLIQNYNLTEEYNNQDISILKVNKQSLGC